MPSTDPAGDEQDPIPRDVNLPGQAVEAPDLDPDIEPEPGSVPDGDEADNAVGETAPSHPEAADAPELGNTLIQPDNS